MDFSVLRNSNEELLESAQLDLEFSNELLPSLTRSNNITKHLEAIRKQFPIISAIHKHSKWIAGELIAGNCEKTVTECSDLINASEYGPLLSVTGMGSNMHLFKFQKPYNPEQLAPIVANLCGGFAEPNNNIGDGDNIEIDGFGETEVKYTFSKGLGDCMSGCIYKKFWQYSVATQGEEIVVHLEREWERGERPNEDDLDILILP